MNKIDKIITVSDLRDRIGTITLPPEIIRNPNEEVLRAIFSNFYPFSINTDRGSVTYFGVSPHFDVIEVGIIPPEYEVVFYTDENEGTRFESFRRRE